MKPVVMLTFALALFAFTLSAQSGSEEGTDSVACEVGSEARTGLYDRECTFQEFVIAGGHCDGVHAPYSMHCRLTSCVVRNNWIVYRWSGYTFG
jgi:hypothetical protein